MMPELDGFGLIKEIRGDENLRDLPVIMLLPGPARKRVSRDLSRAPMII